MVDVIEHVKDWMVAGNVFDLAVWEDLPDLTFKRRPFETSPEVIDDPESATFQVVSKDGCVIVRQDHLFDFAGVDQRVLEQIRVVNRNDALFSCNIDIRQPLQDVDQMPVRARIVRVPVLVITGDPSVIDQTGEYKLIGFLREVVWNPANVVVPANETEIVFLRVQNRS